MADTKIMHLYSATCGFIDDGYETEDLVYVIAESEEKAEDKLKKATNFTHQSSTLLKRKQVDLNNLNDFLKRVLIKGYSRYEYPDL